MTGSPETMTVAEEFFFEHAGWGYDPATETPDEGRRRTARALAAAEQWGREHGLTFEWADDWSLPGSHEDQFDGYDEEPETCESCFAHDADGEEVASLHCIDDATPEYRRVVEAELAAEAMASAPHPFASTVEALREAIRPLIAVRDDLEGAEEDTTSHRAWLDLETAFDAIDSALRWLENDDDGE